MSALYYAGKRLEDTVTIFNLSVGWIECFVVSFFESKAESGVGFFTSGCTVWSLFLEISSSFSCIPNDCEILLNSESHLSDFWKSPLIMMGPLGPGIFSSR